MQEALGMVETKGLIGEKFIEYTGPSVGFLVNMGGLRLYYAGDTGLFGDMKLIGDDLRSLWRVQVETGSRFTVVGTPRRFATLPPDVVAKTSAKCGRLQPHVGRRPMPSCTRP